MLFCYVRIGACQNNQPTLSILNGRGREDPTFTRAIDGINNPLIRGIPKKVKKLTDHVKFLQSLISSKSYK